MKECVYSSRSEICDQRAASKMSAMDLDSFCAVASASSESTAHSAKHDKERQEKFVEAVI